MSWAAKRETLRNGERAYSLLGLFDVNMPLLYGEGDLKALVRLQGEIIKGSGWEEISWCRTRCARSVLTTEVMGAILLKQFNWSISSCFYRCLKRIFVR